MSPLRREPSEESLIQTGPRSEYKKRYPIHPVTKRQNYKPSQEAVKNDARLDDVTISKQDYPAHPVGKRESFRPQNNPTQTDAPLDSLTINKKEFPPHPVERRLVAKPAPENLKSEGRIDFTSTYNNQFHDQPVDKRKPFLPLNIRPDLGRFDAEPSYREDYPEWQLPEKKLREKIEWNPPDLPFVANTVNSTDFPQHKISPRVDYRPSREPVMSDQPFQANTGYKETFKAHDLPPKVMREKELWMKPTEPFDSMTTAKTDFRGDLGSPTKSMRPGREPYRSDAPFDPNTTAGNSYPAHELQKRYRHAPEVYRKPDGDIDLKTTNATQFQPHSVQRQIGQKPNSSDILKGKGSIATETSYLGNFLGRSTERVPMMKPKNDYEPPSFPMETNTVNRSDFHQHQLPATKSFRPKNEPYMHDGPFDDSTDYKEKFKQHEVSPRQQRPKEIYQGSTVPFETQTTAKDSFKGVYQPKRDAINPDRTPVISDAPFDGTTTMNENFKKLEIPKRQARKTAEYEKPDGVMDMMTTHSTNFLPHSLTKNTLIKPQSSGILKGSGEMSKITNYNGDFFPRQIDRVKTFKPENNYEAPSQPLDARTTNSTDFQQKELQKRQLFKPIQEIQKSNDPFDDKTSYRDRFVQHEVTPRKMKAKQVHEPPTVPLYTNTTAGDSFTGQYLPKRGSFKPNNGYVPSETPFDKNTTAGAAFKAWPTQPRFVHKANEYVKPEGNMETTTMNRESYKEVKGERRPLNRLRSSNLLSHGGKFEATTSYSGDFVEKPLGECKKIKPNQEYSPPTEPFDDSTEYKSKLVGYVAPKEKSFKPDNAMSDTLGQRDQGNRYRIREPDWREMLNMNTGTTTVA